jgi:AraC-like DNA-binding protein
MSLVARARFATAASLLEETDTKILDIALDLGYSDHATSRGRFRRWAGCSPQQFRRWPREWQGRSPQAAT